jgi:hypothetical protein
VSALDLQGARVVLRERSLIDVFDLALRFLTVNARPYVRLSLAVLLPCFAVTWVIGVGADWGWAWVTALLLSLIAGTPFTVLASRLMFSDRVRVRDAMIAPLRVLHRLIALRILQILGITVGFFFFVVPAVWVQAMLMFAPEIILLEQGKLGGSILRATRVVHAQIGNAVLAAVLLGTAVFAAPFLTDVAGRMILESLLEIHPPAPLTTTGGGALSLFGFWASIPVLATMRFFFYIDLRTRTEGWDIQTRFTILAARARAQAEDDSPLSSGRSVST